MKHLKKFETVAAFEAAQATLDLPNVSLIEATNGINYLPYVTPVTQYDYIEIGGIKWATCNIGATNPWDTGLYFQWGDTQGYTATQVGVDKIFDNNNYKYYDSENYEYTKYNSTDELTTLESTDDAATVNMGNSWRMPTTTELQALGEAVNTEWTADYQGSGVAGLICTDKTDSSKVLFFPACGMASDDSVSYIENAACWSSTLIQEGWPWGINLTSDGIHWADDNCECSYGKPIRGVLDE